jgi:hypothetical protein
VNGHWFENAFKERRPNSNFEYIDDRVVMLREQELMEKVRLADRVVVVAFISHTQARQTAVNGKLVNTYGLNGVTGQLFQKILRVPLIKERLENMRSVNHDFYKNIPENSE